MAVPPGIAKPIPPRPHIPRHSGKEFRVALLCGATVGTACFVKTMLVDFRLHFTWENVRVSLVVCATIATAILIAKLIGTLLPIGAKKIGFDPAVMASPFLTTIVDTLTLLVYFVTV